MKVKDNSIIEVFEWKSQKAIDEAHKNENVLKLWERFAAVCDHISPAQVEGADKMFPCFEPVN